MDQVLVLGLYISIEPNCSSDRSLNPATTYNKPSYTPRLKINFNSIQLKDFFKKI